MDLGAWDVISNPVDVEEDVLSRVDDEDQSLKQADKEKPIEYVFFGVYLDDSWLFEDLIENGVDWYDDHDQEKDHDYAESDVYQEDATCEVIQELDYANNHEEGYRDYESSGTHRTSEDLSWSFLPAIVRVVWQKDR